MAVFHEIDPATLMDDKKYVLARLAGSVADHVEQSRCETPLELVGSAISHIYRDDGHQGFLWVRWIGVADRGEAHADQLKYVAWLNSAPVQARYPAPALVPSWTKRAPKARPDRPIGLHSHPVR